MKTPRQPQHSAADLLLFADLIHGYARRLENLVTWQDVLQRHYYAVEAGESPHDLTRFQQAWRESGEDKDDVAFFTISWQAERSADEIFETDTKLNELSARIRAIEQREGLGELDEFDPDHPETPADWKALNGKSNRRFQAVEKIRDARFIRWLRRHGETDMADLFANDRAAFDRRREAGRCILFGPMPDINADTGEGDTGVTEVISQNE
jgi:hypothetical protein